MKKLIVRLISFALIFSFLFYTIQNAFIQHTIDHYYKKAAYSELKKYPKIFDVYYVGTSTILMDISPMIIWNETGITSLNLGVADQTAMAMYYQILSIFDVAIPKLLVISMKELFYDGMADDDKYESTYRTEVMTLPTLKGRYQLIKAIYLDNQFQKPSSYFFPLLRFHSRWNELIKQKSVIEKNIPEYLKGGYLKKNTINKNSEIPQEMESLTINSYSLHYYMKILDLCKKNNVPVVGILFPRVNENCYKERKPIIQNFCNENNIKLIDCTLEKISSQCNMDINNDFGDFCHLNVNGNFKFSQLVAQELKKNFDLPDHRNQPGYEKWEQDWTEFEKVYANELAATPDL